MVQPIPHVIWVYHIYGISSIRGWKPMFPYVSLNISSMYPFIFFVGAMPEIQCQIDEAIFDNECLANLTAVRYVVGIMLSKGVRNNPRTKHLWSMILTQRHLHGKTSHKNGPGKKFGALNANPGLLIFMRCSTWPILELQPAPERRQNGSNTSNFGWRFFLNIK